MPSKLAAQLGLILIISYFSKVSYSVCETFLNIWAFYESLLGFFIAAFLYRCWSSNSLILFSITLCSGMHAQLVVLRHLIGQIDPPLYAHLARHDALSLFFCYRWILILFKREFNFDQVLRLWEALWAKPGHQLHLYLAAAVLCRQRRRILEESLDFDGLLELCVQLAGNIDLEMALADAEKLRIFAGEAGEALVGELPPLI